MDNQLVIKLTSNDSKGVPIGLVESPPMLFSNLKEINPQINFNDIMDDLQILSVGYGKFEWSYEPLDIPYNKKNNYIGLTKHSDGFWRQTWELRDATNEEIENLKIEKSLKIRNIRNRKLKFTDWVELPISNLSADQKIIYDKYRQTLRDIPQQPNFPWNVTFPNIPE
jgi:hypothetical protein